MKFCFVTMRRKRCITLASSTNQRGQITTAYYSKRQFNHQPHSPSHHHRQLLNSVLLSCTRNRHQGEAAPPSPSLPSIYTCDSQLRYRVTERWHTSNLRHGLNSLLSPTNNHPRSSSPSNRPISTPSTNPLLQHRSNPRPEIFSKPSTSLPPPRKPPYRDIINHSPFLPMAAEALIVHNPLNLLQAATFKAHKGIHQHQRHGTPQLPFRRQRNTRNPSLRRNSTPRRRHSIRSLPLLLRNIPRHPHTNSKTTTLNSKDCVAPSKSYKKPSP